MTQRRIVENLLHERGSLGVAAHGLNYHHGITRSAAIIHELRREGWDIETIDNGRGKMATYRLRSRQAPRPTQGLPFVTETARLVALHPGSCRDCHRPYARHVIEIMFRPHEWITDASATL
jgi:hypothetical protein